MDNPFKKRATEFIEEPLALLSLLSAEPVRSFFEKDASTCFDRLTLVVGTPGSGKTTLARLMEIDTLTEIIRSTNNKNRDSRQLAMTLLGLHILEDMRPSRLAHRIPCGSNFRSIWELPYQERTRSRLLKTFIQVKASLGWLRKLERLVGDLGSIKINLYPGMETQTAMLRAEEPLVFREYGREVEESILTAITSLVPPSEEELANTAANAPYNVFDCIESFTVASIPNVSDKPVTLRPMVIIDDAHELHERQFDDVEAWLRNREIKMSRWIMTRVDAIGPGEFRKAISEVEAEESSPGTTTGRDRTIKLLQGERRDRKHFRAISHDVCRRYFAQMPIFQKRGIEKLDDCLSSTGLNLSKADLLKLERRNIALIQDARFPKQTVDSLKSVIPDDLPVEEKEAILHILLHREKRKTPQVGLFEGIAGDVSIEDDAEESDIDYIDGTETKRSVKSALITGAAIQLTHEFDRPFYYSFDRLADASSDNIELFISLAGALVDAIETRILRNRKAELDAKQQHSILTRRADEIMRQWDFPHCESAKKLIAFIASRCVARTLELNAPLSDGANAFGIPQSDMDRLEQAAPELVPVIHYAIAYNAITLKEHYNCKKRVWCLFALGGIPIVANRLTLGRGGFCEGRLSDLKESIQQ